MGHWALEAGKMVIYMTFPVAIFHYFNQPEYFEKFVIESKRNMYPPENEKHYEELEKLSEYVRKQTESEFKGKLERLNKDEQQLK